MRRRYVARDRCLACQSAGKTQKCVPVWSSFGESRLCLFSLLELLSSPSQCLLRLFLVQLLYPCSQNCCVAQKGGPALRDSSAAWLRWILGSITPPISPRL